MRGFGFEETSLKQLPIESLPCEPITPTGYQGGERGSLYPLL